VASCLDLIDSWSAHVLRLGQEGNASESSESDWSVHDYIAALYIRDQVQRCINQATSDVDDCPFTVLTADELLRSFTLVDTDNLMHRVRSDLPSEPWWWGRIPARGPIARDLQRWRSDSESGGSSIR
jgi:hypothetical protein